MGCLVHVRDAVPRGMPRGVPSGPGRAHATSREAMGRRRGAGNTCLADPGAHGLVHVGSSLSRPAHLGAPAPFYRRSALTRSTVQAQRGSIGFLKKNNTLYNRLHFF